MTQPEQSDRATIVRREELFDRACERLSVVEGYLTTAITTVSMIDDALSVELAAALGAIRDASERLAELERRGSSS